MASIDLSKLKEQGQRFANGFTTGQKAVTIAAVIGVFLAMFMFTKWENKTQYAPLFTNLDSKAAGQVTQALDAVLMTATTREWVDRLGGNVPIAPVYDVRQALENPLVAERQLVLDFHHPEHGTIRGVASPVRLDSGEALPTRAAPRLGADTDALLGELGYAPSAIAAMRGKAAVA